VALLRGVMWPVAFGLFRQPLSSRDGACRFCSLSAILLSKPTLVVQMAPTRPTKGRKPRPARGAGCSMDGACARRSYPESRMETLP